MAQNFAEKMDALNALVIQGVSARKAIKEVFGDARKFHEVLSGNRDFRAQYSAAMEIRADLLADEIVEISDSGDDPQKARNRIAARQWLAAKLKPRTYGERLEFSIQHSISVTEALTAAKARLLPVAEVIDAEVLETSAPASPAEDPQWVDIFD